MNLANKIAIVVVLIFSNYSLIGQMNADAYTNYSTSKFENIDQHSDKDAIVIFDRTYFDVNNESDKVLLQTTIHRKIKINSLYGLEQFNKLYISTFTDLNYKIEFVGCKAKILKKNGSIVKTDESELVTTTLPANAPFFYKKEGNVKMLALSDVSIGDEIEYVYSTRSIYQIHPSFFYKTNRVSFSNNFLQLEKSIFFNSKRFESKIWAYNFSKGYNRDTDFSFKDGKKITLKNINPRARHPYTKPTLEEPYIYYIISNSKTQENEETWKNITQQFKASEKDIRESEIYDGENISSAMEDISSESGTIRKFMLLLKKTNSLLEENFHLYENFRDNIDISWSYSEIISKMMKRLEIPVSFHFVVNKNFGKFDPNYVSIYQFDNILVSFLDKDKKRHFMPLLEPYSKLDEIKNCYSNTDCFTIHQSATGKRSFAFEKMPNTNLNGGISKNVKVNLKGQVKKGMLFEVEETLTFSGNSFIDIKPELLHIANDSLAKENFRHYIENQIVSIEDIDSVYAIKHSTSNKNFSLSYQYTLASNISEASPIISFKLDDFVDNYFYTPIFLRERINSAGYLDNEHDLSYSIEFNFNNKYNWIENELLICNLENMFGQVKLSYEYSGSNLKASFKQNFKKEKFAETEWPNILMLRDQAYDALHSNLYALSG